MSPGEWIVPIAIFVLGQLSIFVLEWVRNRQARSQRGEDFQRQTLLELQETLDDLAREGATVVVLREKAFRLPCQRKDVRYDDPHAEAALRADVRLPTLVERVDDDEVRALSEQLHALWREAIDSQEADETARMMKRFRDLRHQANKLIGILLRSLWEADAAWGWCSSLIAVGRSSMGKQYATTW